MAAAIEKDLGVKPALVRGSNGIFDVVVDGQLIYSKDETGQFPEHDEIIKELRARS